MSKHVIAGTLRIGHGIPKAEYEYGGDWVIENVINKDGIVCIIAKRFEVTPGPYGGAGETERRFWFWENEIVTNGMKVWNG